MTYVQNTDADRAAMLAAIGAASVDELMAVIPPDCRLQRPLDVGPALSEDELLRHVRELAARNVAADDRPSFLGAGAYHHFCPALVDSLVARTEFWTAYTPYQPEASQGTLTTILEWQSMLCRLTGMEVSNASLYDGATAVVEAALMALRLVDDATRVIVSAGVHPDARGCLATYLRNLDVELVELPLDGGRTRAGALGAALAAGGKVGAVILQSPNFFGVIEDCAPLVDAAHEAGALVVVSADPVSLSVLEPPGNVGADMVCGEATGMGNPPWFGGPGVGYLCGRMAHVRQMPARIAGETKDEQGRRAVVLTFQTREQHIRRTKATSNICTSQQLMALRATIWMTLLGKQGFAELGRVNLSRAHEAARRIAALEGYSLAFPEAPFFNEFTVRTPRSAAKINRQLLEKHDIIGGYDLGCLGEEHDHELLLAVTDMSPPEHIDRLVTALDDLR